MKMMRIIILRMQVGLDADIEILVMIVLHTYFSTSVAVICTDFGRF